LNRDSSANKLKPYVDKINPFYSENKYDNLSPSRNTFSGFFKSSSPAGTRYSEGVHTRSAKKLASPKATDPRKPIDLEFENGKLKLDLEEAKREIEALKTTMTQKFGYVKTSARNLIISSTKLSKYLPMKNSEEELAVKVFEADKKALETYLSNISDVISQFTPSLTKSPGQIRSQSHEKKKRGEDSSTVTPVKRNIYLSERLSSEEDHRKEVPSGRANRIKAMIDEFDRNHSDLYRGFEKDPVSSKIRPASAQNFFEAPNTDILVHIKDDVSTLKKELFSFKIKYEQAQLEIKQLKEENGKLQMRSPKNTDIAVKYQELKAAHAALVEENKKLTTTAKKYEKKCQERKKNLKQLFELLQEKDKEINFYKKTAAPSDSQTARMDEALKDRLTELETQYALLEQELQRKDRELAQMYNIIGRTSYSEPTLEDTAHFNEGRSSENHGKKDPKVELLLEDVKELDKKKQKLEDAIISIESISPSKASELRDMVTFLEKERESTLKKVQSKSLRYFHNM